MHGIIFLQLRKFIKALSNDNVTEKIYKDSGMGTKFYDATKIYPDAEIVSILNSACKNLNVDRETALEEFGKFIAPGLLTTYKSFIKPEWKCMDLLENIENTIHKAVRASNANATPPALKITRPSLNEVVILYHSTRHMISLGIGIIKKIAEHYNEKVIISKMVTSEGTQLTIKKL